MGRSLEEKLSFGSVGTRGYTGLILTLVIIARIGVLFGQKRNVERPNDGPSFSFASIISRTLIITAAFFAYAWTRDFAQANIGDAAILAILPVSIMFAIFSAMTAFYRSD